MKVTYYLSKCIFTCKAGINSRISDFRAFFELRLFTVAGVSALIPQYHPPPPSPPPLVILTQKGSSFMFQPHIHFEYFSKSEISLHSTEVLESNMGARKNGAHKLGFTFSLYSEMTHCNFQGNKKSWHP